MKLEPERWAYSLPEPIGELCNVCILNGEYVVQLSQIPFFEIATFKEGEGLDSPRYFYLSENTIFFSPIPDKEYDVRIRFYPPMKEM